MMEEAQPQNAYIQCVPLPERRVGNTHADTLSRQRGQAIEAIESTINELGSIFGQLAQMVSEQSDMIQRIDANTYDVPVEPA
jgi:syntaxin 5